MGQMTMTIMMMKIMMKMMTMVGQKMMQHDRREERRYLG